MRLSLSYRSALRFFTKREVVLFIAALIAVGLPLLGARQVYSPNHKALLPAKNQFESQKARPVVPAPSVTKPEPKVSTPQSVNFNHINIVSTIFWVGESASGDNGGISNKASAWDEHWQDHFGGVDTPNRRNGYLPAGFTPKENPFYIALPYSDITDSGKRKVSATSCPLYNQLRGQPYSWCKNSWIALRHGGRTVYAQWEDVGPFEEDDFGYVFGGNPPKNSHDVAAGIDVSPAVAIYLGLGDVDRVDWGFIAISSVPTGVWSQITTANPGESI